MLSLDPTLALPFLYLYAFYDLNDTWHLSIAHALMRPASSRMYHASCLAGITRLTSQSRPTEGHAWLGRSTKPAKNKAPRLEQLRPQISLYYSPTRATATSYQSYETTAKTMSTTLSRKRPRLDIATASAQHGVMAITGSNENPIVIEDGEDDESETGIEDGEEDEDEGVDEPEWSSDDPYEEVVTDEDQDEEEEQEENNEGKDEHEHEHEDEDEGADEYEWSSDDPYEEVVTDEEQDEGDEDDTETANEDRRQRRRIG